MLGSVLRANLRHAGVRRLAVAQNAAVLSTKVDSFLSGSSSIYVEQMYDQWLSDPVRYVNLQCWVSCGAVCDLNCGANFISRFSISSTLD